MATEWTTQLEPEWRQALTLDPESPWLSDLFRFVQHEREQFFVYPPSDQVFAAFQETPFSKVRVVILGQDPYHGPGQAQGLSFSVPPGVGLPPSLRNIYRELREDLGGSVPVSGSLLGWAHQGVLLLNAILTVREGSPGSHQGKGWEQLTDTAIERLWTGTRPIAFVAWGRFAAQTLARARARAPGAAHLIIESPHPSPLSAHQGFFGSKPFSLINSWLTHQGEPPIDWGSS